MCHTSATCIDLIFTNIRFVSEVGVVSLHLSDHKPVFLIKKKSRNKPDPKKLSTRGSKFDYEYLETKLNKIDWGYVKKEKNPSFLWDRIFHDCLTVVNRLYPFREFTVRNNRPKYLDDEIIQLGKDRDVAFERAAMTKSPTDWELAVKARRKENSVVRMSKYNYINNNIEDSKGDPKKFWRQVRQLIPNIKSQVIDYVLAERRCYSIKRYRGL